MLVSKVFYIDLSDIIQFKEVEGSELASSTEQSVQNEGGSQDDNNMEELPDTCGPEADAQRLLLKQLTEIYDRVTAGSLTITEVQTSPHIQLFHDTLQALKNSLQASKTSKLWLQYMDMMDILRKFLKDERTGNWNLHLQAMHNMQHFLEVPAEFL